jgi:hypothetical protein
MYLTGQDSAGACTGLAVWNDTVFQFFESAIYVLSTDGVPANWSAKALSTAHGCIAPRSIAVAPSGVIFLAADGVRSYGSMSMVYSDDESNVRILSDNIKPTLMAYTDSEKKAAVGVYYKGRYWLSIANDVYVCDLEKRTSNKQPPWTKYAGLDVNSFFTTRGDEYGLYAGSKTSGTIYQLDVGGTDNGAPIPLRYVTPPLTGDGYRTDKHFRHMFVSAEAPTAQDVTVTLLTDDIPSPPQVVSFDANTDTRPVRIPVPSRGRFAQVVIESSGLEQPITVSEISVVYNPSPKTR